MTKPGARAGAVSFTPTAIGIFLLALLLRTLHLWQLRASPFLEARLGDAVTYDAWALTIAAGDWLGSEVFAQAPLYPYFLALIYSTLGDAPPLVRGVQCVLSALGCAFVASAGARLFSHRTGLVTGLLLAGYAPSIFMDALLQKSVLDFFFVALGLVLAARLVAEPRARPAVALGVAIGALALARENALILAGVFGAWLVTYPGLPNGRRFVLGAAFVAGVATALAPVAIRNAWIGGELHLTTYQGGVNLYIGNHPGAWGGYEPLVAGHGIENERQDMIELAEQALGRTLAPSEVSAYWTGLALEYITSQPLDWLRLMGRKLALLLSNMEPMDAEDQYATAEHSSVLRATGWLGRFGVLAPLAVLGAFVTWPRRRELWWIHAAIAAYAASVLVFYVFARYRYPFVPFLALLAGAGLVGARGWWASSALAQRLACGVLVLALAFVSNFVSGLSPIGMRAVAIMNVGHFYEKRGEHERADEQYRQALALDPSLADATNGLARALIGRGRIEEAIAVYQAGIAERPKDARLHANLGAVLRGSRRLERAAQHYRTAIALDPENAEARSGLGDLYVKQAGAAAARGETAAALAHYQSALALRPDLPAALWGAAWILATDRDAGLRRPEEALELAERASAASPKLTAPMLETLAAANAAVGNYELARQRALEAAARMRAERRPLPKRLSRALELYEQGQPLMLPLTGETGLGPDRD